MMCKVVWVDGVATCTVCGRKTRSRTANVKMSCRHVRGVCKHLGGVLRLVTCPTCKGNVKVKVFACAVLGECTSTKGVGLPVCVGCTKYEPSLQTPIVEPG